MKLKDVTLKDVESTGDGGTITAYAATFDREPDCYGDIIAPGAFADTLAKWRDSGKPIPLLFGHQMDDPMMNIGALTSAEEDEHGLRIEAKFDADNQNAQYARKLAVEGRVSKLSFAYDVVEAGVTTLDDGTKVNELRKLDLYEVSLVTVPANMHAEVIEAKSRHKYGAAISKANGDELAKALANLEEIVDQASQAMETIKPLIPDSSESPDDQGDEQGGNAPEGDGEEGGDANSQAKSRELTNRLKNLIR